MMLSPCKRTFFAPQEFQPQGWLLEQLRLEAQGLCGNLDRVWPDIRESRWIGGSREGWERVPYWLDGFIPLAWMLGDDAMQSRATHYIDAILARQQPDGWLCPCDESERDRYDIWALFLICKVLVLYADCTDDPRVEDAVYRALFQCSRHIEQHTLFDWAQARWFECLIPLYWLYERRPEQWMEDLAVSLRAQGMDYPSLVANWRFYQPYERGRWSQMTHVVNWAMALKSVALASRLTHEDGGAFARGALEVLLRDHGMAVGHFTGDECLSGTSPIQGSELCSVVEAMYSYEWLLSVTGEAEWADRLELLAFNALPAALSEDLWAHQYDQMTNQIACSRLAPEHTPFRTNNGEAHLFGLEPHFGCCTANFGQGWPKFAQSVFLRAPDGVAVGAIAPCAVQTEIEGVRARCEIVTDYPFGDGYTVRVETEGPARFALYVRFPRGAAGMTVDGIPVRGPVQRVERVWEGVFEVHVSFTLAPCFDARPNGLFSVRRGPLVFALPIEDERRRLEYTRDGVERKFPYCDYELLPRSPWAYGFAGRELRYERHPFTGQPFAASNAPATVTVSLAPIDWPAEHGVCAPLPRSVRAQGEPQSVALIPYGCARLRMTELPFASR